MEDGAATVVLALPDGFTSGSGSVVFLIAIAAFVVAAVVIAWSLPSVREKVLSAMGADNDNPEDADGPEAGRSEGDPGDNGAIPFDSFDFDSLYGAAPSPDDAVSTQDDQTLSEPTSETASQNSPRTESGTPS